MDDRNLVAVAEQAAATSKVLRSPIEGCTVLFDDGRVHLGCRMEFEDSNLDQDALSNSIAAGRVEGSRKAWRVGMYSPLAESLPKPNPIGLLRLKEIAVPGLAVLLSSGTGERVERSLEDLLAEAGVG